MASSAQISRAYNAIRGINPPPHVEVRLQTHPEEFSGLDERSRQGEPQSFQLPLISCEAPENPRAVPTISAGEVVRGMTTLLTRVRDSFDWDSADIMRAIAGWWDAPVDKMTQQCADDTLARRVYAIAPEVGALLWEPGDDVVTCSSIIESVASMLALNPLLWEARWKDTLSYQERIDMVATQHELSSGYLFSLLRDADVLAALNGENGESSFVGDFMGYAAPLSTVRAPEIDQPERFMSLASRAMDSGLTSFHDLMLFVGSQGAVHASLHPFPVTHASIEYRLCYDDHLWNTEVGRLLGSPSLPRNVG